MAKGTLRVVIAGDDGPLRKTLGSAGGAIGGFAAAGAAAIGAAAAFSVKSFADFDQAMTNSVAIMGDVSDAMRKDMSDAAREVAKTTKFSATEAAESYFFLASAGLSAEESIAALPRVAAFAQAGNFDMALATDLLTDAQSALGLSVDDTAQNMENMSRVSDVLVKANTLANASVEQFSTSLTNKAGAALRSVNKDVEEGVAVLSVFADQGIKGERAGEALAITLRDLSEKSMANKDAFKEMNVAVFDADGEMNNMADIVGDLEGALEGMSTEQKIAALSTLGFTGDAQKNILALLGNSDALREYEEQLRGAGGTTKDVADKQMETFHAQLGLLKDQLLDVALGIGERLMPHLMRFVAWLQDVMPHVEAFIDDAIRAIGIAVNQFLIPAFRTVREWIMRVVEWFRGNREQIRSTAEGTFQDLSGVWERIKNVFSSAIDAITAIVSFAVDVLQAFWRNWGETVLSVLRTVWDTIIGVIQGALDVITGIFEVFAGIFTGDWDRVWEGVKQIFGGIWDAIVAIVEGALSIVIDVVGNALRLVWQAIRGGLKNAWNTIVGWGKDVVNWFKALPGRIFNALGKIGSTLIGRGRASISGLWGGIKARWSDVAGWFRALPGRVRDFFSGAAKWLSSRGKLILSGLFNAIKGRWLDVRTWFRELPGKIKDIFANAGNWLWNAGSRIIGGLWDGIKSGFGMIKDGLGNLGGLIPGWKGPPDFDAKLLTPNGRLIIDGLMAGIDAGTPDLRRQLQDLTRMAETEARGSLMTAMPGSAAESSRVAGGSVTVQVINEGVIGSQRELQDWLTRSLENLRRRNRLPTG